MKKKIGISFSETNFHHYWNWLTPDDLNDDLQIVELSFEKNNVEDIPACDGFILTGGIDVHHSLYDGDENYPHKATSDLRRDIFEKKIFEYTQIHNLPLLGLCRGLQLVNVLQGGKLIQDLEEDNLIHWKTSDTDKQHGVRVQANTLLHSIVGEHYNEINSAHHQAIHPNAVGNNLLVNACSETDGTIEGIEFNNKEGRAFMLCVQWHPERMINKEQHLFSQNIKKYFLKEVRNTMNKKLSIVNPATEVTIAELNEDTQASVTKKFEILKAGQKQWQAVSLEDRIEALRKFARLLQQNKEELAMVLTSEMGKPLQQAQNEINGAWVRIKWLTQNAGIFLTDEVMADERGMEERISYEPLGVVCNISAWNYPYLVGVNVFIPALLGGNAVMYKPSEYATLTGLQIEKFLKQAGVPEEVFQVAIGGGSVGEYLLDLPFNGYFFTGSYKTGKYIYERVASKMVPCQCELGGKDPLYVADDVNDIKFVAASTADGAFYNNGQSCCSVERIYVHQNIYDEYLDAFVSEVKSYKSGLPTEEGTYIGPLSRKEQLDVLQQQVDDALAKGATLLTGGKRAGAKGYYFEPTVLVNVNHEMTVMKEESFGPVVGIMKVTDDEEAIRLMQDTEYGLTASVYATSQQRAEKILQQINTGTGYWNCCDRVSPALPWSGRKHSGIGATLSHAGLRAFVKTKAYHLRAAKLG